VPVRKLKLATGEECFVTSVFDLQVAQYGIDRGLGGGNVAKSYDDANVAYTPAWAAKVTGVKAADIERTGREFADNAAKTGASPWSSWARRSTTGTTTTCPTGRS
jgi:nitrate reductase alpha subunit